MGFLFYSMKDTFYFSHDYNARQDDKIKRLIMKHGLLGYGIYWAIVENLYNNANALRLDCELIAYEMRTSENVIDSIINEFDLFVIDGDNFGSLSIERRLNERNEKSKKARDSANSRWEKLKNDANALPTQSECNAIKESKGKENIVKEIIDVEIFNFSKSFLNLGVNDIVLKDWIKVRKSKKLTNSETAFKAIKKEIDKSGLTANECILKAVEKSWGGFEYEWIKNKNNLQNANTKRDLSEINHSTATKLEDM